MGTTQRAVLRFGPSPRRLRAHGRWLCCSTGSARVRTLLSSWWTSSLPRTTPSSASCPCSPPRCQCLVASRSVCSWRRTPILALVLQAAAAAVTAEASAAAPRSLGMLRIPPALGMLSSLGPWPAPLAPPLVALGPPLPPLLLRALAPFWSVPRSLPLWSLHGAHLPLRSANPPWWTLWSLLLRLLPVGFAAPCIRPASALLALFLFRLWGVLVLARSPRAPMVASVDVTVALACSVWPLLLSLPSPPQARRLCWRLLLARLEPLLPSLLRSDRLLQPTAWSLVSPTAPLLRIAPSATGSSAVLPLLTPRAPTLSTSVAWSSGLSSATAPAPCAGMGPSLRRPSISPITTSWRSMSGRMTRPC